jgi:hypothetical protein
MTMAAMAWSNSRPFLCAGMFAGRWQVRQHELRGVFLELTLYAGRWHGADLNFGRRHGR